MNFDSQLKSISGIHGDETICKIQLDNNSGKNWERSIFFYEMLMHIKYLRNNFLLLQINLSEPRRNFYKGMPTVR